MSECWASSGHGLKGPGYQLQVEGLSCNYVVSAAAFVIGHVSRAVLAASWVLSGTWSASLTVPVTNDATSLFVQKATPPLCHGHVFLTS